jgi:hypothetical protein
VHRCNAEGLAGLSDRPHPGPTPRLTPAQLAELARIVEAGPDPATDGVVRWRRVDLQAVIARRFGVRLHERSVGKALHRLGFARLLVRPVEAPLRPLGRAGGAGSLKNFGQLVREVLPEHAAGKLIEIWFEDG